MEQKWTCLLCSKTISAEDTVVFTGGHIGHCYCGRPRALGPEERALLYLYCWGHAIVECPKCAKGYRQSELAFDLVSGREHLCPQCHAELLDSVRAHLYNCAMLPAEVRRRAQVARETARALVKQGRELGDRADVLMREAEAAIAALRETMRNLGKRRADGEVASALGDIDVDPTCG